MSTVALEAALKYAAIGWKVFPIVDKKPLTEHAYLDATLDIEQLKNWWTHAPDARIGLALRPSGLLCIDVDIGTSKVGDTTLAELEAKHGPLPRNNLQHSGGGGLHFVMKDPSPGDDGWTRPQRLGGSCRGSVGPNVDVKNSGYIVVEPSGTYEWLALDPYNVSDVPASWIELLRKPEKAQVTDVDVVPMPGPLTERVAVGKGVLASYVLKGDGQRVEHLAKVLRGEDFLNGSNTGDMRIGGVAFTIGLLCPEIGVDACLEILGDIPKKERAADSYLEAARQTLSERKTRLDDRAWIGSGKRYKRTPELTDFLEKHAGETWVPITVDGTEIVKVRPGGTAILMAPPGGGKSSFAIGASVEHATLRGPVINLSRELPADEDAARVISIRCDVSWPEALTGKVPRKDMERALDLPRRVILDRQDANLEQLEVALKDMQAEYPGQSILVTADYAQILDSSEKDARSKVSDIITRLDNIVRKYRVVLLLISQMSRASSRAARSGEAIGGDTADLGAESSSIERVASVTLTIGESGPMNDLGVRDVALSIGKNRMFGGDRVVPMSYCGRSGKWKVTGPSRSAHEVREEKLALKSTAKTTLLKHAIPGVLEDSSTPLSRNTLRMQTGARKENLLAAVERLLSDPESGIVEVEPSVRGHYSLWTKNRVATSDRTVFERVKKDTGR